MYLAVGNQLLWGFDPHFRNPGRKLLFDVVERKRFTHVFKAVIEHPYSPFGHLRWR
jgi:hypothetical protein